MPGRMEMPEQGARQCLAAEMFGELRGPLWGHSWAHLNHMAQMRPDFSEVLPAVSVGNPEVGSICHSHTL